MNLLLPESSGRNRYWLSLRHPLNLDVDVGVDVHLSAFHGLMASQSAIVVRSTPFLVTAWPCCDPASGEHDR
jgi:hypothetical protein